MVKIFSPYAGGDQLGSTLANLGKQLFGDKTANMLNGEKLYAAERENTETDNLMRRVAGGGAQTLGADPLAQATIIGSGYDPTDFGKLGLMGAATGFGAQDPRTQNWQVGTGQGYDNTFDAFSTKAAEVARANSLASSDRRYNVDQTQGTERWKHSTVGADQAVDNAEQTRHNTATEGETARQFDEKPLPALINGQPGYAPQSGMTAPGVAPIRSEADVKGGLLDQNWDNLPALNPQQQQVIGANPAAGPAPWNYVMPNGTSFLTRDGVTDVHGKPLPLGGFKGEVTGAAGDVGLTNSVNSDVQQGILANNKLSNLLNATREVAMKDPTNFGIPGFVKGVFQDSSQIAQGMAVGLGYQGAEQLVEDVQQRAMKNGVSPGLLSGVFDPDLSSLHTLSDLVVYSAAEALAGQKGKAVSDRDVAYFKGIVGDPTAWMMSQDKYLAKLTQIERVLAMNQKSLVTTQQSGAVDTTGAPPPAAAPIDDLVNKYRSR